MVPPADPAPGLAPGLAYSHIKRAQDLLRARDAVGARREAELALQLPPADFVARNVLGSVLYELGDLHRARALFQDVLAESPRYGDALNNLGNILVRDGKPRAAVEFYERALAGAPDNPDWCANLGGARQALGDLPGALECFDHALALAPGHADARWNRALARLLSGDLAQGFADYEARWSLPEFIARPFTQPQWTGGDATGQTILIHSEQGYGDTIQMVRFAASLAAHGARVLLETHAALAPVMRRVSGIAQVIVHGDPLPAFDAHIPVMSLPHACGVASLAQIPVPRAYIHAAEGATVTLPPRRGKERRIGLVWAGRPTHKNDRNRSLDVTLLAPVASVPDVSLVSLQIGARAGDLAALPGIVDLAPQLTDFGATARILEQLDLVVTVDTAVAHLAGAMGKDCWVMLPFAPDWRWLLGRDSSVWYPSLRLYRQPRIGDWTSVVARIVADLISR